MVLSLVFCKKERFAINKYQKKQKSLQHFGLLFAVILVTWWIIGMIYTLGHNLFTGLLPSSVYNVLSYPIAGPFLFISEYLLSGHIHLFYHILLAISLGFGIGIGYGLFKISLSK